MKLYFYKEKNFGDTLNIWLWEKLIPELIDDDEATCFVGIGTLINSGLAQRKKNARKIVFSTGVGYGKEVPKLDDSWKIYCLRGPLSADKLNVSRDLAVTDGALLIRKVYQNNSPKKYKFSYMPHYELAGEGWSLVCQRLGFGYIDPRWSIDKILEMIGQSEVLLAEAMHGAIVADTLRVPWIPVISNQSILQFKWQDWCMSINVDYQPVHINRLHHPRQEKDLFSPIRLSNDWFRQKKAASELLQITKTCSPYLSKIETIERLTIQLEEKLEQLKNDFLG